MAIPGGAQCRAHRAPRDLSTSFVHGRAEASPVSRSLVRSPTERPAGSYFALGLFWIGYAAMCRRVTPKPRNWRLTARFGLRMCVFGLTAGSSLTISSSQSGASMRAN